MTIVASLAHTHTHKTYTHIHTYTHTYTQIHAHKHTHTHIHAHTNTSHICKHICPHTHAHTHTHTNAHTHTIDSIFSVPGIGNSIGLVEQSVSQPQSHTNYTNTRDRVLCGLDSIFSVFSRECLSCWNTKTLRNERWLVNQ